MGRLALAADDGAVSVRRLSSGGALSAPVEGDAPARLELHRYGCCDPDHFRTQRIPVADVERAIRNAHARDMAARQADVFFNGATFTVTW